MKILHFVEGRCNPDTSNGVDKTVYFLCVEQARMGHEVHLVCTTERELIPVGGAVLHRMAPFGNPLRIPRGLRRMFDEIGPDVVHLHSAYVVGNLVMARLALERGIPYVVTPNGNCARSLMRRRPWLKVPYKVLLERPMLNRAAFVHSVGDTVQIQDYGVKVPVVEGVNGIDLGSVPELAGSSLIRERYPDWREKVVFLFVGRLDIEQKGLDILIEGLARVREARPEAVLLLVGPEWQGSVLRLEEMISRRGLAGAVRLHGPAYGDEKYELMASADVFVHASRWEGLPFAVVEAMASGRPCLVTKAADPAGFLAARRAGVVVEAEAVALAGGMEEMLGMDREVRARLGIAAVEIVAKEMQWAHTAAKVCDAYRKHCMR